MPPEQCPECGRYLKAVFVQGLATAPAPCPRCGSELTSELFGVSDESAADEVAPLQAAVGSVRPPDLEPDAVRGIPDPLDGWDVAEPARVVVDDRPPFPADTVVVVAAAVLGAIAGGLVAERPGRGASLGALGGVVCAGSARRIWQLVG